MVGYYLGVPQQKVEDIQVENQKEEHRRVALLDAWDVREGEGATFLKLAEAFHHRKRIDLVVKLCEKIIQWGSDSTNTDKASAKTCVKEKLKSLEEDIETLNKQLSRELEKKSITHDDLIDNLTFLPVALRREYEDALRNEIVKFGDTCKSVRHVFRLLINPLTTFLDYKLLEHLISKFGSSQLKQDMVDYVDDVNRFKRDTTVAELMEHWDGIEDRSMKFTELHVRFGGDPTKFTLESLDTFRKRFCSHYKLTELVMILVRLKPGSFIGVWQIPCVLLGDVTKSIDSPRYPFDDEDKTFPVSMPGTILHKFLDQSITGFALKQISKDASSEHQSSEHKLAVAFNPEVGSLPEIFGTFNLKEEYYGDHSIADSGIGSSTYGSRYSANSYFTPK